MSNIKIAIIGAGIQASRLVGQVTDAGARVVAVHDIKIEAAKRLSKLSNSKRTWYAQKNYFSDFFNSIVLQRCHLKGKEEYARKIYHKK